MSKFDAWPLAFPEARAEHVLEKFAEAFRMLAETGHMGFAYTLPEPKITEILCVHLQSTAARMTVVGEWLYEVMSNTLDMKDRRRTDIMYTTTHNNTERVRLIFECKKIDGPNRKNHRRHVQLYKKEGMLRYAEGSYARDESFGFMVSFSQSSKDGAAEAIQRSFGAGGWPVALQMAPFDKGAYWRSPPIRFPGVVSFETLHLRAKPFPEQMLYHINLAFS